MSSKETEKEPIVVQFKRNSDFLGEVASSKRSPDCIFLSLQSSPNIDWKVSAIRKGEVLLKELSDKLSVRLTIK